MKDYLLIILNVVNRISLYIVVFTGVICLIAEFVDVHKINDAFEKLNLPITYDSLLVICGICMLLCICTWILRKKFM